MRPPLPHRVAIAIALLVATPLAGAQVAPAPDSRDARVYEAEHFARFSPRTALDMLQQVPGFVIRAATQERGLGQATGNVLLNGQRLAGKSNDALAELGRIPAGNVVRIEILDGATLDIPGLSGQVANVVTHADRISGQWAWKPEFRRDFTDPLLARGDVSIAGERGALEYTAGLELQAGHSGAGGPTDIYNADWTFREHREDVWTGESYLPKLSGRLAYDPGDGVQANVSASYQRIYFDFLEVGQRTGPGLPERERTVELSERGYAYELGGDYAFGLGPGRLKLIGLYRDRNSPFVQTVVTTSDDGTQATGSRFAREANERERIARAEYRWETGEADWQVSTEAAFNELDSAAGLFVLNPDGRFDPVPLPGGTATVEEDRYELMGSHGRPLTSALTMQLSAGAEYSNLRQVGAGGLSRTFVRPKGQLALAWKASPDLDVNVKLQRRVGQLAFGSFLASVNLAEERRNAGNPELVPQQSWDLDVEAVRKFGAWGNATVRLYGRRIDDIVDIVPIGEDQESPGNIDRAVVYGLEWKSTLLFDPMGWRGAKLDTRLILQESELVDPLTGEKRPISNNMERLFEANFRHDVPETEWAYGASLFYHYSALNYRLTEVGRQWEGPLWAGLFVEHKNVRGLTVRVAANNLFGATSMWDRTVYAGRRTGPIAFHEVRDRTIGPIYSVTVSGRF